MIKCISIVFPKLCELGENKSVNPPKIVFRNVTKKEHENMLSELSERDRLDRLTIKALNLE